MKGAAVSGKISRVHNLDLVNVVIALLSFINMVTKFQGFSVDEMFYGYGATNNGQSQVGSSEDERM